jgi:hypothetical protein
MLILKYFVAVGLALTVGVWAIGSYLESQNVARAARTATTSSLAVTKPAETVVADTDDMFVGPHKPDAPAAKSTSSRPQGNRDHRRPAH